MLIAFDDVIVDVGTNKKLSPIVTELFMRGEREINILFVFISQYYFAVPNSKHDTFFIIKISNKKQLQQIALNHLFDIKFKAFMKLYKDYTKKQFLFLVNGTTIASHNSLRF